MKGNLLFNECFFNKVLIDSLEGRVVKFVGRGKVEWDSKLHLKGRTVNDVR
jgi:hypothetical protein